jgi:hypothetical protein
LATWPRVFWPCRGPGRADPAGAFCPGRYGRREFERYPIPYALETDWPVEAAGFEPLHFKIGIANHPDEYTLTRP